MKEFSASEDPQAGNYFESDGSPGHGKKLQRLFSVPSPAHTSRKGSSPKDSPNKDKKKFSMTLGSSITSPFSSRRKGSKDSPKHSVHSESSPSRKGSDTGSTSSSGMASPRTAPVGVNPSLSHPMIRDKGPEIVRSISVGSKIPSPTQQRGSSGTAGRLSESPDAIAKRPLPQPPRSPLTKANTFTTNDDYEPSFYEITAVVHTHGDEKGASVRGSQHDCQSVSKEAVEKKNIKNGGRCSRQSEIDGEEEEHRSGRSPKRHTPPSTTPPESHSPKRQHISEIHQMESLEHTQIDIPHGNKSLIDTRSKLDSRLCMKSSRESPDPGIEVSPTGTLDSEGMSKCGSSSTMSIGSEASPTLGIPKEKAREKSRLPVCKLSASTN